MLIRTGLAILLLALPRIEAAELSPILAMPIDQSLLEAEGVKELLAELVAAGGYGRFEIERAAFLRLLPDGTYHGEVWPLSAAAHQATFTGEIPDRTIAIVHTHPLRTPQPSHADRELARRLSVPILVLTPRHIVMVDVDGRVRALVTNSAW